MNLSAVLDLRLIDQCVPDCDSVYGGIGYECNCYHERIEKLRTALRSTRALAYRLIAQDGGKDALNDAAGILVQVRDE